jgi:uncharacterized protein
MGSRIMYIDLRATEPDVIRLDESLELTDLKLSGGEDLVVKQARLQGMATRGPDGVDLRGRLHARLEMTCCRCLEIHETSLDSEFQLILVPDAVEFGVGEKQIGERESLLFYAEDGRAELDTIACEQIYLNLPLKPLCREDCQGLCPTCGANRNRLKCGCRSEELDPRLAPLLELKKKLDGS